MMNGEMMGNGFMAGWGGMLFGPLVMVLFLGLLIAGCVMLVRWMGGGSPADMAADTPLAILKKRFAAGEIDRGEFEERRDSLLG